MLIAKRKGIVATLVAGIAATVMAGAGLVSQQGQQRSQQEQEKAKVGEKAPGFTLKDLDGKEHTLASLTEEGKIVVLEWFNPECPFVQRHYSESFDTTNKLAEEYEDEDVVFLRINSGAAGQQGTGVDKNKRYKDEYRIEGPLLLDESGKVGQAYGAQTTPHMYVIDKEGVLRYQGGLDNDPRGNKDDRVNYVRQALDQVIAGETVSQTESRPYGCPVKYSTARN